MNRTKRYSKFVPMQAEVAAVFPVTPDEAELAFVGGKRFRAERATYGLGYWPPAVGDVVLLSGNPPFLSARPRDGGRP